MISLILKKNLFLNGSKFIFLNQQNKLFARVLNTVVKKNIEKTKVQNINSKPNISELKSYFSTKEYIKTKDDLISYNVIDGKAEKPIIIKVEKFKDDEKNQISNEFSDKDFQSFKQPSILKINTDLLENTRENHIDSIKKQKNKKTQTQMTLKISKDKENVLYKAFGQAKNVSLDLNLIKKNLTETTLNEDKLEEDFESNRDNKNEKILYQEDEEKEIVFDNLKSNNNYFSDMCKIYVMAGKGGNGSKAMDKGPMMDQARPDGGSGGRGGSIVFKADETVASLSSLRTRHFKGNDGSNGQSKSKDGKEGKNITIHVPVGTLVYEINRDNKEILKSELRNSKDYKEKFLIDLDDHGKTFTVCRGGDGGIGNRYKPKDVLKSKGKLGEEKELKVVLKVKSDVCLVGFPNAGKSSLLAAMTRSMPKIANYEFTTLHPHLGKLKFDDFKEVLIEDLPGLVKDAHLNKGLGHRFLKHIDRSKIIIFLLDGSLNPEWTRNPKNDLIVLKKELENYNKSLLDKPYIIVLNKNDSQEYFQINSKLVQEYLSGTGSYFLEISAKTGDNLQKLVALIRHILEKIN